MFGGIPVAIIAVIAAPFMLLSSCKEDKAKEAKYKAQQEAARAADPRSLPEKAGAGIRDSVKDFGKGLIFGKPDKEEEKK